MKTFIISHDAYMDGESDIYKEKHADLMDCLEELFGSREDLEEDEVIDTSDETFIEYCKDANGDGMPYYVIFCIEDDRKVFG